MEHNIGTLPGKFETNLVSDSGVGAGDQRFFSLKSEF
jgi:hypothetical protein